MLLPRRWRPLALRAVRWLRARADELERAVAPRWSLSRDRGFYFRGRPLSSRRPERWWDVLRRGPCPYCGRPADTVDHVTPRSAGGDSSDRNVVGACRACNQEKASTPILHYLVQRRQRARAPVTSPQALRNAQRRAAKRGTRTW